MVDMTHTYSLVHPFIHACLPACRPAILPMPLIPFILLSYKPVDARIIG